MAILSILPARVGSERLPNKPLRLIAGRPVIEWAWESACRVPAYDDVWVATDSEQVAGRIQALGGIAILTSPDHVSGTDRVAEVAALDVASEFNLIVNHQADELFLEGQAVDAALAPVLAGEVDLSTLACPVTSLAEWEDEDVVKVALGRDGRAVYFSRAGIPHLRGAIPDFEAESRSGTSPYLRHVGLYVYTRAGLETWAALPASTLENIERLEQLRPLEAGLRLQVIVGPSIVPGIDSERDLIRAEEILGTRQPARRVAEST
jgi:3-deoxy-manno-octulosonate cytidylyltransferase (CMP-KDO synthetase)